MIVQGLDVGGIGTQSVFGDDELEMGVIVAELGDEAFGRIPFTMRVCPCHLGSQWVRASMESLRGGLDEIIAAPNI